VEHQRVGFQRRVEFFRAKSNCLVVIVGTDNIKLHAVAHESSGWLQFSSICLRRPCIALPGTKVNVLVLGRSGAAPARPGLSIPHGSANPRLQTDDTQNLREDCGLRGSWTSDAP
jgi:hypothetical protein